jgi:hypothetical protein
VVRNNRKSNTELLDYDNNITWKEEQWIHRKFSYSNQITQYQKQHSVEIEEKISKHLKRGSSMLSRIDESGESQYSKSPGNSP